MIARLLAPISFGYAIGVLHGEGGFTVASVAGFLGVAASVAAGRIAMRIAMPELQRLAEAQKAAEAAPPS